MRVDVVVNGRFTSRAITGVERYAAEVTKRLDRRIRLISPKRELRGVAGHFWEQFSLPRRINQDSLLWSPANTGPLVVARQIVTIHDCSPLDHPQWFQSRFAAWYRLLLPNLVRQVRLVITDSEFSQQRIIELCRVPEEKVRSIPCGVDPARFYPRPPQQIVRVSAKYGLSGDYVLMVGSLDPRKNLTTLFKAWEIVSHYHGDVNLVIAGGKGHAFRNMRMDDLPTGTRLLGYVDESDLPFLYSGAVAYVNPSLYEGFGLSVLEAMACGTAVVASNNTALPEVVGEAGLLVDPHDTHAIAAGLRSLISEPIARKLLARKGLERARMYSWENTAEQIWNTMIQAYNGG